MGASAWVYWTAYEPDIEHALKVLRRQVFESQDYYLGNWDLSLLRDQSREEPNLRAEYERQLAAWRVDHPEPKTIEELIDLTDPDGTHSIIDMLGVSEEPELLKVFRLTEAELLEHFSTNHPTRGQVEARLAEFEFAEQYWPIHMAFYVITYRDGVPDQIGFVGASGD